MGRGRSGRVSANRASRQTSASHPQVTDINAYGDSQLEKDERIQWLQNVLGTSNSQAETDEKTIWSFTGGGFDDMHWNRNTEGNDIIDAIMNNPNSPVYVGEQYRGLKIRGENGMTPQERVEAVLNSGVWREDGATSFSASLSIADDFSGWHGNQSDYVSVVVRYQNPTTGMPIKHLSRFDYENEVLHSRQQMTNGYRIVDHQWLTGKKKVVITIADK